MSRVLAKRRLKPRLRLLWGQVLHLPWMRCKAKGRCKTCPYKEEVPTYSRIQVSGACRVDGKPRLGHFARRHIMTRAICIRLIATAVLLLALAAAPHAQARKGNLPAALVYSDVPIDIMDVITQWCEYNNGN